MPPSLAELTCPSCGTVYRGGAIALLRRASGVTRVGETIQRGVECLCVRPRHETDARPVCLMAESVAADVVGHSKNDWRYDLHPYRVVGSTPTCVKLAGVGPCASEGEYRLSTRADGAGKASGMFSGVNLPADELARALAILAARGEK